MNFVYISPQFPKTNWEFCDRLKKNGVTVLGIADAEYDSLDVKLKDALTEYYKVSSDRKSTRLNSSHTVIS